MKSISELFEETLRKTTDDMYCVLPCQVEAISGNYVDVRVFINEEEPDMVLYNVPIQRPETQRAYIFLGIKKGDRGVLKFFDRSTEGYLQSDFNYNSDERQHDLNDRVFSLGFIPDNEAFVYPTDQEIEIGLKNVNFKISIDNDGNVNILSNGDITLNITGDVTSTIKGDVTSTVTGDVTQTINGNSTTTVTGDASLTATNINTTGILNQVGAVNVNGAMIVSGVLTATRLVSQNGTNGEYSNVVVQDGIVTGGS